MSYRAVASLSPSSYPSFPTLIDMLSFQQLSIGYKHNTVARGLSTSVPPGALTCLLGRNGIGKSTLLRTLSGYQPPLSGTVLIDGQPLQEISRASQARLMAIVLTGRPSVSHITSAELVALGRSPYTGFWGTLHDSDRAAVDEALRQVGMETMADRQIQTLSDGEMQKLMIAKALAQNTPVILLDEPTAFLDFPSKVETMQLLHRLAETQQKTILLSTHDVELAVRYADHLMLFDDSGIHAVTRQDVLNDIHQLTDGHAASRANNTFFAEGSRYPK